MNSYAAWRIFTPYKHRSLLLITAISISPHLFFKLLKTMALPSNRLSVLRNGFFLGLKERLFSKEEEPFLAAKRASLCIKKSLSFYSTIIVSQSEFMIGSV